MALGQFISYLRVSTQQQADSGLGIDAQRAAITRHLNGGNWTLIGEYVETESGKKSDRPQLLAALAACRRHRATLIVGRLDRLARNVAFVSRLMEAGVDFVACDNPTANKLTIHILSAMAEHEREMISARTIAALAQAKARGKVLGNPRLSECRNSDTRAATSARARARASADEDLRQIVIDARACGDTSIRAIGEYLSMAGVPTAQGNPDWSVGAVRRLLIRLDATPI